MTGRKKKKKGQKTPPTEKKAILKGLSKIQAADTQSDRSLGTLLPKALKKETPQHFKIRHLPETLGNYMVPSNSNRGRGLRT